MRAIRTFFRHLKTAFVNLFRNGLMTAGTLLTMTLTLTMVGSLVFLMINVQNITQDIEEGVKIRTHIDLAANEQDEAKLKESIQKIDHVANVVYSSKEDEYSMLVEQYGSEFELFQGDNNPFYNVYVVSVDNGSNLESVTQQIRQLPFVVDASYGEDSSEELVKVLNIVRAVVAGIAAIFIVIAVLLITNTIRLTIDGRSTEIEIMRLVGAKNSYIKAPLIIEGAYIGLLGSLLATGMVFGLYQGLRKATINVFGMTIIKFAPIYPTIVYTGIGLMILGLILGMIGASRSTKRYLTI